MAVNGARDRIKFSRCNRPRATPRKCDPVGSNRLERPTIMASVATQSTALVQQRVAAKKVTREAKKVAKADKPKRAKTGYLMFCDAERPSIKHEIPDLKPQEVVRELPFTCASC